MTRIRDVKSLQNAVVFLLIAHLLIVVAVAASPHLHQLFHRDADHGNHECVVTLMISGGSDGSPAPQVLEAGAILPTSFNFSPEAHSPDVSPLFLGARVFEHAPPFA
jgi:hypothetical protein